MGDLHDSGAYLVRGVRNIYIVACIKGMLMNLARRCSPVSHVY